jgi:hypothetical protein
MARTIKKLKTTFSVFMKTPLEFCDFVNPNSVYTFAAKNASYSVNCITANKNSA